MNNFPEDLNDVIMACALAPSPQSRFLMTVGLMACLPRTEEDESPEILSAPGLVAAVMNQEAITPVAIDTADGSVLVDPDEQLPFFDLLDVIDSLSRNEEANQRVGGVGALVSCALTTPDWVGFS